MKAISIFFAALILVACQTTLPEAPPADFRVEYSESGGLSRIIESVSFSGAETNYLYSNREMVLRTRLALPAETAATAYALLRNSGFDRIRTEENDVMDGGAMSVALSLGGQTSYVIDGGLTRIAPSSRGDWSAIVGGLLGLFHAAEATRVVWFEFVDGTAATELALNVEDAASVSGVVEADAPNTIGLALAPGYETLNINILVRRDGVSEETRISAAVGETVVADRSTGTVGVR